MVFSLSRPARLLRSCGELLSIALLLEKAFAPALRAHRARRARLGLSLSLSLGLGLGLSPSAKIVCLSFNYILKIMQLIRISIFTSLLLLLCPSLWAQLSVALAPFEHVKILGVYEVELIASDSDRIEITSRGIEPEAIKISQQNNRLKLGSLQLLTKGEVDVKIQLYYRHISSLELAGGVQLRSADTMRVDDLFVRAGSGSQAHLVVDADFLDARAAEGGMLTLTGEANKLRVAASTGGILDGHRLRGRRVTARAATGGEVSFYAIDSQDVRATAGGVIQLLNKPDQSTVSTSIGGEVTYIKKR